MARGRGHSGRPNRDQGHGRRRGLSDVTPPRIADSAPSAEKLYRQEDLDGLGCRTVQGECQAAWTTPA
eukprot:12295451-Alexandrium_andersonii.AAC.1